ncbi:hypothetical protein [Shinella zoogloeoides]|uniref:hypothetical protein n=1 Tax=Shinella zoogloeoides TaxID=352475 RepID=UPI00273E6717|nr:hypothetical protein [Shinella zoogloeoides]WLR94260.1 hypothetical protein Q9316_08855 [Shinella zoogloeoides]
MMKLLALTFSASLLVASAAYAQEDKQISPLLDDKEPQQVEKGGKIDALTTNCYTNVRGCEGFTKYGPFSYAVGCTVWYNDGANGHSNFTLGANQSTEVRVRYNDTGACVGAQYAPPRYENGRYYLYVHN